MSYLEFEGELVQETDLAYCIDLGQEEDVWIPKSVMKEDSVDISMKTVPIKNRKNESSGKTYKTDWIKFEIKEYIAQEKGLI